MAASPFILMIAAGLCTAACASAPPSAPIDTAAWEQLRTDSPFLGREAPEVKIVYPAAWPDGALARIYVFYEDRWHLAFSGPYVRGNLHVGRGSVGNRFRMLDQQETLHDLTYHKGTLTIRSHGKIEKKYVLH